jgi:hypothetical protein
MAAKNITRFLTLAVLLFSLSAFAQSNLPDAPEPKPKTLAVLQPETHHRISTRTKVTAASGLAAIGIGFMVHSLLSHQAHHAISSVQACGCSATLTVSH